MDNEGSIFVEIVRYFDFTTNQNLKEVATEKFHTPVKGTLWDIHLAPPTEKILNTEQSLDRGYDFPLALYLSFDSSR